MKLPLLPCALLLLLATAPGPGPWPAAGMLPSVPCLSVCLLQSGPQQMLLRARPLTIYLSGHLCLYWGQWEEIGGTGATEWGWGSGRCPP